MIELLSRTILMGTPLLYGSLSEVYSERSGVMNTAIEGIFLMGAWAGFVAAYQSGGNLAIGMLAAMGAGLLTAALYGWIAIFLKQQQIVTGVAINILALGICAFFQRVIFGVPVTPLMVEPLQPIAIPLLSEIPIVGPILFDQNILTYLLFILVPLASFVLYRTSLGLSIRSVGENPEAGDVAGIRVDRLRFLTILFAGVMCGVGGAFYSIGYLGMFTTTIIGGRGWIAFAICFLGNWKPYGVLAGTLVFGLAEAVAISMQSGGESMFPNELFIALPYILTIVLTVARRSFNVPAQLGVPYKKEG
ncbi:MAG: ABC transporter permease [Caldilinea sp.]|nr:ABC transporter permease [Caldilinea sp.]MCB0058428.1 ABC transporter permease [Caldilineaceae bacterium]MCB9140769.1 ABC transporter permease [Anaerolineales bacterium]MCB0067712.1 ABC transporter permease [Caldilineaceae bacterium]MCB0136452.1 ABC transporter permease [Caldilineaceae bacterium]